MRNIFIPLLSVLSLFLIADNALAHTGLIPIEGISYGFMHPFSGLDHFLVISGLGLWAGLQPKKRALVFISMFMLSLLSGALLAVYGFGFAYVETAILVSVLLTAILLLLHRQTVSYPWVLLLTAIFAGMHGLAHGVEMPLNNPAVTYFSGFGMATLLLLSVGVLVARRLQAAQASALFPLYGGVSGLLGTCLLFAG